MSKRSRHIAMTSLMCGASVSMAACDDAPTRLAQWQEPPAKVEQGQQVDLRGRRPVGELRADRMRIVGRDYGASLRQDAQAGHHCVRTRSVRKCPTFFLRHSDTSGPRLDPRRGA